MNTRRPYNASLFADIGEPSLASSAELRAIQANCMKRHNQNCFFLTVDLRPPASISWHHNTTGHFRRPGLSFADFSGSVHPHWLPTARQLTAAGCEITWETNKKGLGKRCSYSGYLPLRQGDGSYVWYKHFLLPGTLDQQGKAVHLHHECLRLGPFHDLRPFPPILAVDGIMDETLSQEIKLAGGQAMEQELKTILTNASYRNLVTYRLNGKVVNGTWTPPASARMRKLLSLNQQALNKANTRILSAAKIAFPKCILGSVGNFAGFLNEMFGRPDE